MELTQLGTIEIPHTPRLVRKEDVVKVSFRQGLLLFSCLATFLLAIMVVVVYFGFWLHLYDQHNYLLLVVSGGSRNVNFVPLNQHPDHERCQLKPPPEYPIKISGAVGTILSKRVRICGGQNPETNATINSCYTLDYDSWKAFARLSTGRAYAASVRLPKIGWWITGGVDANEELVDSSELLQSASSHSAMESGPLLPQAVAKHCMIRLDDTRIMLIGGITEDSHFSDLTWYYQWNRRWVQRHNLNVGRHSHSCIYDGQKIFAAGGATKISNEDLGSTSVEVFDLKAQEWNILSPLPARPILGSVGFLWNGHPAIIGGQPERKLLKWKEEKWIKMDEQVAEATNYPVALSPNVLWVCE